MDSSKDPLESIQSIYPVYINSEPGLVNSARRHAGLALSTNAPAGGIASPHKPTFVVLQ